MFSWLGKKPVEMDNVDTEDAEFITVENLNAFGCVYMIIKITCNLTPSSC